MPSSASTPKSKSPKKPTATGTGTSPGKEKKKVKEKKDDKPAGVDIRGFFSQGASSSQKTSTPAKSSGSGTGNSKKPITIDDSDEEEEKIEIKPQLPKPSTSKAAASTSKHFNSSSTKDQKPLILSDSDDEPPSKPKPEPKPQSTSSKRKLIVDSDESDEPVEAISKPPKKRQSIVPSRAGPGKKPSYNEDGDSEEDVKPAISKAKGKSVQKEKEFTSMEVDESSSDNDNFIDDDDEDDDMRKKSKTKKPAAVKKAAPARKATSKSPAKKAAATPKKTPKTEVDDNDEEEEKKPKFNWRAAAAAKSAGPKAPGSKEIPEGAPDCLAGLTFVFTGEMESLGREEAGELIKRYSGRVTGAPSKKTSYVVVGENAGESKLKKIKELSIPTMTEDELLEFIRSRKPGGGPVDAKTAKARAAEEKKIADQAAVLMKREKEAETLRKRKEAALEGTGIAAKKVAPASAQLWTTKYAPQTLKEICGNKAPIERLGQWLQDWSKNYQSGFKKPGKEGTGIYRAVLISGPPGIGKTTSAHLMAKIAGYNPIELNASDARSKKLVENSTNIDNASLDGFFQGKGVKSTAVAGVRVDSRTCLIMDEVDGMSAGDRGGVGALNVLIRKTKIPMILICNDRSLQKMKPLQSTTYNMPFRRPSAPEIRSRIMSIMYKEKMKIPPNVVDELVSGVNSDIRQVLNMLSTYKLGKSEMDFDEGKNLVKLNEKNTIMTPFTIIDKLTGPYAFAKNDKRTLGDKMELYFHDFSFVPLFMQEHYIKTNPAQLTNNSDGPEKILKNLELVSKAADSISDGDLIDRMIHGSEQHWSLLPLHAVASTVKPASLIYGPLRPGGSGWGPAFPQWLGQNSKQNKLARQLTDIQIRMRLRVSGGKAEIREQYMPLLASKVILPLVKRGQDALDETIEYMDEYFLGKEDWDALVELGVDSMNEALITKKIPTAVKTAFTRQYNKADHPIAFHKGDMFASSKKKIADTGPAPDNEDVFEDDEPMPDADEEDEDGKEDIDDVSKDKLIKAVKPKASKSGKGKK